MSANEAGLPVEKPVGWEEIKVLLLRARMAFSTSSSNDNVPGHTSATRVWTRMLTCKPLAPSDSDVFQKGRVLCDTVERLQKRTVDGQLQKYNVE